MSARRNRTCRGTERASPALTSASSTRSYPCKRPGLVVHRRRTVKASYDSAMRTGASDRPAMGTGASTCCARRSSARSNARDFRTHDATRAGRARPGGVWTSRSGLQPAAVSVAAAGQAPIWTRSLSRAVDCTRAARWRDRRSESTSTRRRAWFRAVDPKFRPSSSHEERHGGGRAAALLCHEVAEADRGHLTMWSISDFYSTISLPDDEGDLRRGAFPSAVARGPSILWNAPVVPVTCLLRGAESGRSRRRRGGAR